MVVEIEESAEVLILRSRLARLDLVAAAGGLPDLSPTDADAVGGRCDTQSWTKSETRGLCIRFCVFRDWALLVIMMTGPWEL